MPGGRQVFCCKALLTWSVFVCPVLVPRETWLSGRQKTSVATGRGKLRRVVCTQPGPIFAEDFLR